MPVQFLTGSQVTVTFSLPGPVVEGASNFVWVCPFASAEIVSAGAATGWGTPPAVQSVIVDVNLWDSNAATPGWSTIYTTQGNRPVVPVGEFVGSFTVPDVTSLTQGDALAIDVDQSGGGATPTDEDLVVTVLLRV